MLHLSVCSTLLTFVSNERRTNKSLEMKTENFCRRQQWVSGPSTKRRKFKSVCVFFFLFLSFSLFLFRQLSFGSFRRITKTKKVFSQDRTKSDVVPIHYIYVSVFSNLMLCKKSTFWSDICLSIPIPQWIYELYLWIYTTPQCSRRNAVQYT